MATHRPLLAPSPPLLSPKDPPDPQGPKLPDPIPSPLSQSYSRRTGSSRSRSSDKTAPDPLGELRSGSILDRPGSRHVGRAPTKRSGSERAGSQRELADEEARFVYINDPARTNQPVRFPDNSIRTAKYSVLSFLPRNLFEQFHRVAYVYFLILAGLNQVPQLGVFSPVASVLPLAFVLGVTAVKDAYEDWRRHRSDRAENARIAHVFSDGEFAPKPWREVQVGELVRVAANETLPCDMVVLSTSDPTGVAYVQTINLDGESNLKTRYARQETQAVAPHAMAGTIRCERPNRNIYGFHANLDLGGKKVSLGPSNIILRGCELKNTAWALGVAVYTGKDTKVMLNSSGAPSKRSRLEAHMNRETILLAVALAALCTIVSALAGAWLHTHRDELDDMPFYRKRDFSGREPDNYEWYGIGWEIAFTFMSAVIQFQVLIPIALYISMELVRVGQAYFMIQDKDMFDESTNSRLQCRALNINEDLGQIKYVFSDKTGTLTENKMEFRCASVQGVDYSSGGGGGGSDEYGGAAYNGPSEIVNDKILRPKMTVATDPELRNLLRAGTGYKARRACDFFLALATCNTIVPIEVDTSDPSVKLIDYQGESPDEQALVYAAAAYGFVLIERTSGHIIIDIFGERQRYFLTYHLS
ncbi:Phospholipid-transporting ATPase 1 [Ananas comosus]|uniref:Phospholipid-transporting ATPase n=1 Tax=Ananas comosus TaxID=4615 RepID=A0A199V7G6_ANACO|nr:Phospholipid-transporting ATPase 1 [Ananas comosus]